MLSSAWVARRAIASIGPPQRLSVHSPTSSAPLVALFQVPVVWRLSAKLWEAKLFSPPTIPQFLRRPSAPPGTIVNSPPPFTILVRHRRRRRQVDRAIGVADLDIGPVAALLVAEAVDVNANANVIVEVVVETKVVVAGVPPRQRLLSVEL